MSIEFTAARTFCSSRKLYEENDEYVHIIPNLTSEWKKLFNVIHVFYQDYEADSMDAQEMHDSYDMHWPNARDAEELHMMITEVFNHEPKPDMIRAIMEQFIEKHKAAKMIDMLVNTMAGDKFGVFPKVVKEAENFFDLMENPPDELEKPKPIGMTITELVEEELMFDGLKWPLEPLNDVLGGIRKGTLGLIYAYVDVGKTSLAMNVAAHAAKQLVGTDDVVCYLGNEEPAKRLALRGVQAFMHCTRKEVLENHTQYTRDCMGWGYDKLKFFDGVDTGDQIIAILKEYKPRLAIIDIATDVEVNMEKHYGSEGVGYLKSVFKWYRRITNRFDTSLIAVSQGTGDIENKRYPKLSDVIGSRSAVQGALDYAIGIGQKIDDAAKADMRYINIPKNKLHDGLKAKFAVVFKHEVNEWLS